MIEITAIILASGTGSRVGGIIPKQFADYKGKPLIEWSISFFNELPETREIIIVVSKEYQYKLNTYFDLEKYHKVKKIVVGGATRQASAYNGIKEVTTQHVFIHDAARPNINLEMIGRITDALSDFSAVVPCTSSSNTVYKLSADGTVENILDRNSLGIVQTPQAFETKLIREAHEKAKAENKTDFTDDAGLILFYKLADVKTVAGDENNLKVTYKSDFE